MTGNGTFQCIPNSLSMKASSPQIHVLCSIASHRGLFRVYSDFQGLLKSAYQIGSSCKMFYHR